MEWIYVYREPFNLEIKYSNIEEGKLIYEGVELIPQGIEPKFNFHYKAIMSFKDSSYGVVYYYSAKPDFIEICKVRRDETMKNLHEYLLSTKNEFFEWLKNEREP